MGVKIVERIESSGNAMLTRDKCSVIAFGFLYLYALLKNTMLYGGVFKYLALGLLFAGATVVAFTFIVFKPKYRYMQFMVILLWVLLAVLLNVKDFHGTTIDEYLINLVFYVFLGAIITRTDFDHIADAAYFISLFTILGIMLLAKAGFIENLVYYRENFMVGKTRAAFGFGYPTDFAAHVFYWMLLHFYRRRGFLKLIDYALFAGLAFFLYRYCDARLTVATILLLILVALYYGRFGRRKKSKLKNLWNWLLGWITPICAVVSIGLVLLYRTGAGVFKKLDALLSNRLSISSMMLERYGIRLFGQYFGQHGFGSSYGNTNVFKQEYTYVDISYLRILMMFGVVFFVLLMIMTVSRMRKYVEREDYLIPVVMLVVSICSMVDQHFMDFSYNVFLLTIFIHPSAIGLTIIKKFRVKSVRAGTKQSLEG